METLADKRALLVGHLRQQGVGVDADPDQLIRDAGRALRLCDLHWRYADPEQIRQWAAAYACAVRVRERHWAA